MAADTPEREHHGEKELAEFIRNGMKRRPEQAFGDYYSGMTASCALGAAYEAMYRLPDDAEGRRPTRDLDWFFDCLDTVKSCPAEGCKKKIFLAALLVAAAALTAGLAGCEDGTAPSDDRDVATVQVTGGVPLVVGDTLRLVATYADASNFFDVGPNGLRATCEVLRGHCADVGRDYDAITKTVLTRLSLSDSGGPAPSGEPTLSVAAAVDKLGALAEAGMDDAILGMGNQTDPNAYPLVAEVVRQVAGITAAGR